MNALTQTFDSLGYFEKLKDAGVPEPQARVQADTLRQQTEAQRVALQSALDRYDEASRRELATRGDVQDVRGEIQEVRSELQEVRGELKEDIQNVRSELKEDIQNVRNELKEDIQNVRSELQNVRSELKEDMQNVRNELKEDMQNVRGELKEDIQNVRIEMKAMEIRLLKWQLGIMTAGFGGLVAIMAKGFGWLGF